MNFLLYLYTVYSFRITVGSSKKIISNRKYQFCKDCYEKKSAQLEVLKQKIVKVARSVFYCQQSIIDFFDKLHLKVKNTFSITTDDQKTKLKRMRMFLAICQSLNTYKIIIDNLNKAIQQSEEEIGLLYDNMGYSEDSPKVFHKRFSVYDHKKGCIKKDYDLEVAALKKNQNNTFQKIKMSQAALLEKISKDYVQLFSFHPILSQYVKASIKKMKQNTKKKIKLKEQTDDFETLKTTILHITMALLVNCEKECKIVPMFNTDESTCPVKKNSVSDALFSTKNCPSETSSLPRDNKLHIPSGSSENFSLEKLKEVEKSKAKKDVDPSKKNIKQQMVE